MTAQLAPNPVFKAFDNNGNPLSLGLLYSYIAGTSTPQATYTDYTQGTPNANPVVLNVRGEAAVWLDPTKSYKLVLADSVGNQIWTADQINGVLSPNSSVIPQVNNVYALGSPTNAWSQLYLGANAAPAFSATSGNIGYYKQTTAELSASVTPTDYSYAPGDVRRYGADPTGVADSTTAINNALLVALNMGGPGGFAYASAGLYKITSVLTVGERVHLRGDGKYATRLLFSPTGNATCLQIKNASSICDQGSVKDLCIYSNDSTFTKIAIDIVDTNAYQISGVSIGGSVNVGGTVYWSGANSIGLQVRGRQTCGIRDIDITADRPIVVAQNPNSTVSIDHFNFHNCYLIANANPVVEILTGVNLSNVSFTGHQAWVKGTHGLYWLDTTTSIISLALMLQNIRWEQGTSSAAYLVSISHNAGMQGLRIENCYGGADRNGYYFRKVSDVYFGTVTYTSASLKALDADSTVSRITMAGCFWQAGSTATLAGQRLIRGAPLNPNTAPLPPDAYYDSSSNAVDNLNINAALTQDQITVANNGVANLGPTTTRGILMITTDGNEQAIFSLNGTNNSTNSIADPAGVFSTAASTASKLNIYWSAGNSRYEIQNLRGASRNIRVNLLGTYS